MHPCIVLTVFMSYQFGLPCTCVNSLSWIIPFKFIIAFEPPSGLHYKSNCCIHHLYEGKLAICHNMMIEGSYTTSWRAQDRKVPSRTDQRLMWTQETHWECVSRTRHRQTVFLSQHAWFTSCIPHLVHTNTALSSAHAVCVRCVPCDHVRVHFCIPFDIYVCVVCVHCFKFHAL